MDDISPTDQEPGPANLDDKMDVDPEAPTLSAAGIPHTTNTFISENKQQVAITGRPALGNFNTHEVEMRDGPAMNLFTASSAFPDLRDIGHVDATETQQNQPMSLSSSAGLANTPISQEMSVAAETQHSQLEAPNPFAGVIIRPEKQHKPFATEEQLHQPVALSFSAGVTSRPGGSAQGRYHRDTASSARGSRILWRCYRQACHSAQGLGH